MTTVNVIGAEYLNKKLDTVREAIIYRAGFLALCGNKYQITLIDADGYIIPESEIAKWIVNIVK